MGWDGLGWLDLARFRVSGGCFRRKTGFSLFVGYGGYVFMRPKAFPSSACFGFADLWPRFWNLDVPGGYRDKEPCFASTVSDNDDDRRRRQRKTLTTKRGGRRREDFAPQLCACVC